MIREKYHRIRSKYIIAMQPFLFSLKHNNMQKKLYVIVLRINRMIIAIISFEFIMFADATNSKFSKEYFFPYIFFIKEKLYNVLFLKYFFFLRA